QVVVVEGTLDALSIAVAAIKARRAAEFCPGTQSGRELSEAQGPTDYRNVPWQARPRLRRRRRWTRFCSALFPRLRSCREDGIGHPARRWARPGLLAGGDGRGS